MALHIKNAEVEGLASNVGLLANESKTEAMRRRPSRKKGALAYPNRELFSKGSVIPAYSDLAGSEERVAYFG